MSAADIPAEYKRLGEPEPAFIHGWPREVNPQQGTARLDGYANSGVPLRFDASLSGEMVRLEGKFVKVWGHGWIGEPDDQWIAVLAEKITCPGEEWLAQNPKPKIFDPDTIPRASFDFDVDEFLRGIHESRGKLRKESAG